MRPRISAPRVNSVRGQAFPSAVMNRYKTTRFQGGLCSLRCRLISAASLLCGIEVFMKRMAFSLLGTVKQKIYQAIVFSFFVVFCVVQLLVLVFFVRSRQIACICPLMQDQLYDLFEEQEENSPRFFIWQSGSRGCGNLESQKMRSHWPNRFVLYSSATMTTSQPFFFDSAQTV
jgi:hypothetical protein